MLHNVALTRSCVKKKNIFSEDAGNSHENKQTHTQTHTPTVNNEKHRLCLKININVNVREINSKLRNDYSC